MWLLWYLLFLSRPCTVEVMMNPSSDGHEVPTGPGASQTSVPTGLGASQTSVPTGPGASQSAVPTGPGASQSAVPTEPGASQSSVPTEPGTSQSSVPTGPGVMHGWPFPLPHMNPWQWPTSSFPFPFHMMQLFPGQLVPGLPMVNQPAVAPKSQPATLKPERTLPPTPVQALGQWAMIAAKATLDPFLASDQYIPHTLATKLRHFLCSVQKHAPCGRSA